MNWSALLVRLVPAGDVTVTSTVPEPAGLVAVIEVSELTVKSAAGVPPKLTAVAPVSQAPVMVTDVPPAAGPPEGLIDVTTGRPLSPHAPTKSAWAMPAMSGHPQPR